MDDDIIEVAEQHYILATSSRTDDRTRVLKHGDTFAVFDRFGDVHQVGLGEQGVYHDGTRFLSQLQLRLAKRRPLLLSSTVKHGNDLLLVDLTNPDVADHGAVLLPRGSLHVFRTKFLWRDACYERVRISSFSASPVDLPLSLRFGADFRDVFEVRGIRRAKRGNLATPQRVSDEIVLAYAGLDGVLRTTRVSCDPPPVEWSGNELFFRLHLEPHATASFFFTFAFDLTPGRHSIVVPYEAACKAYEGEVRATQRARCELTSPNPQFNAWSTRSLADLETMSAPSGYPYAGVPWYSTPFGRDGILTALQVLWMQPLLARSVLELLARHQAERDDPARDQEEGKIFHELRSGEMAALSEVPFGRYYGSVDATPLFVMLAGAYYERTGDLELMQRLWPHIIRALHWIDNDGDRDRDGFVEYGRRTEAGLLQQGWKDSNDSVFHDDGELADGPIALCEAQAYVYAAKRAAAVIAAALQHGEIAALLREQAARLQERFERAFWCEELGTYALALDGKKRPCRVRTSNAGHCLFTGIASPERARRVAETLMSADSFSGWGVRTVAMGERRYNPMSYHNGSVWPHDTALIAFGFARYGFADLALRLFDGMFDASVHFELQRMPELFCGFQRRAGDAPTLYPVACSPQAWAAGAVFMLLQACLGIDVRGGERRIVIRRPVSPEALERLTVKRLRVGDAQVDLRFDWHRHDVGITVLDRKGDVEVVAVK